MLISSLLQSRGVRTHIINSIEQLNGYSKLVTEPQFFYRLPKRPPQSCLLIGNQNALEGAEAVTLSRPLTESKIELAINKFLEA